MVSKDVLGVQQLLKFQIFSNRIVLCHSGLQILDAAEHRGKDKKHMHMTGEAKTDACYGQESLATSLGKAKSAQQGHLKLTGILRDLNLGPVLEGTEWLPHGLAGDAAVPEEFLRDGLQGHGCCRRHSYFLPNHLLTNHAPQVVCVEHGDMAAADWCDLPLRGLVQRQVHDGVDPRIDLVGGVPASCWAHA